MRKKEKTSKRSWKNTTSLGGAVALACVCLSFLAYRTHHTWTTRELKPRTLEELLALPDESLARVDIARMNLLCATGLPHAENIDVEKYLSTLDDWAKVIKTAEEKYTPAFYRNPAKYENSLSKFKAIYLVLTFKEDLKCGYNMELVRSGVMDDRTSSKFAEDSRDSFLHGFIERRKGSCASLPVLAVALGRRCGYPLYLVSSKGHLFFRWDDGKERFNVEAAIRGTDIFPDEYYHTYPVTITETDWRYEKFLQSFSPIEELSGFMFTRGVCFEAHGRFREAEKAFTPYLRGFPESRFIRGYIAAAKQRMSHEK